MCLLNYNKEIKKYKHLTYAERTMIETWYNQDKKSKKEIAELLHKTERTIRREINRGKVIIRGYEWEDKEEYSARIAQDKYEYGNPVGTVFIGYASKNKTFANEFHFLGDREEVRQQTILTALRIVLENKCIRYKIY